MSRTDRVFIDAGLFIGALLSGDARHAEARSIVDAARRGELSACTSVGVLAEVYAALTWVGTLPPQTPGDAARAVEALTKEPSRLQVLDTGAAAGARMLVLAARHGLTARRIYDARHAATAPVQGVSRVFTYDVDDWRVFEQDGIVIAGPQSMLLPTSSSPAAGE